MFGAGLIKLRGDPCWRDMSCLDYYYETQPMPTPLSWYFHWGPEPEWTHHAGVWVNHFTELVVPFAYFLPQPVASSAAIETIIFYALIMASGNLSWLNLLTMVLAVPALDDRFLRSRRPEPASLQSFPRSPAAIRPRGALPVRVHLPKRTEAERPVVEAAIRGAVFPASLTRGPGTPPTLSARRLEVGVTEHIPTGAV
jgi:hypothetical protein